MKIGRLKITWGQKGIKPGRVLFDRYGFSVTWLNSDSLTFVNGYISNPDIYTVVNKVTRAASTAPFKVYRIKDESNHKRYKEWTGPNATKESVQRALMIKSATYEEDNDHPLNKLIERPNPYQRQRQFTENSIGFKLVTGERFWHVVKLDMGANEGLPYAVYNLPPQYMNIIGDATLFGISGYELQMHRIQKLEKDEVIFSKYWNPDFTSDSHLRGLSPLKAGSKLNTMSTSALTRGVAMVQNAGAAGVIYSKPVQGYENWTEEQGSAMKVKVNQEVIGAENSNVVAVANGDLGYIPLGIKATEMELLEMTKLTRDRIANIYNVPPVLVNPDHSAFNNIKEAKKELITGACMPELDSLRDDWNEIAKLYPDEDLWVDYDLSIYPELQEDVKLMAEIAEKAWWTKGNEKRLMMYLDEDNDEEMMDKYLIPSSLIEIGDLGMNQVDNALNDGQRDQAGDKA